MKASQRIKAIVEKLAPCKNPCTDEKAFLCEIHNILSPAFDCRFDNMGNLIVKKSIGTPEKRLVIAVGVDAPCLIVTHIDNDGKVRVSKLGETKVAAWLSQRASGTHGAKGVICAMNHCAKPESFDDVYLDFGTDDKTSSAMLVSQGETAVPAESAKAVGDEIIGYGAAAKIKAAVAVYLAENFTPENAELYIAFCVQSNLNSRGLEAVLSAIRPDVAVSIDVISDCDKITLAAKEKSGVYSEKITDAICASLGEVPFEVKAFENGIDCAIMQRAGALCAKVYLPGVSGENASERCSIESAALFCEKATENLIL